MSKTVVACIAGLAFVLALHPCLSTAQGQGEQPPALVVAQNATAGTIAPTSRFIGTLFFQEVSDLSAETNGMVTKVRIEDGDVVKRDQVLVELDSQITAQQIIARQAQLDEARTELDKARLDLERMTSLHKTGSISDEEFDTIVYKVQGLEKKVAALRADVKSLEILLSKKTIRAPFDGVILDKLVAPGEWVEPGAATVAVLARSGPMEAVFNLPQDVFPFLKVGSIISIMTPVQTVNGIIQPLVLRGDVATRTFPVKVRLTSEVPLVEGMAVQADFPVAHPSAAVLVPRDALINFQGRLVVFTVVEGAARPVNVEVIGYAGDQAGLATGVVTPGSLVVVKGNERLFPGQPVQFLQ